MNNNSLINAISREDVDEVINLIENGADVNAKSYYGIHL